RRSNLPAAARGPARLPQKSRLPLSAAHSCPHLARTVTSGPFAPRSEGLPHPSRAVPRGRSRQGLPQISRRSFPFRRASASPTPLAGAQRKRRSLLRSEEHTSELQSRSDLVCRLLLEKKKDP